MAGTGPLVVCRKSVLPETAWLYFTIPKQTGSPPLSGLNAELVTAPMGCVPVAADEADSTMGVPVSACAALEPAP